MTLSPVGQKRNEQITISIIKRCNPRSLELTVRNSPLGELINYASIFGDKSPKTVPFRWCCFWCCWQYKQRHVAFGFYFCFIFFFLEGMGGETPWQAADNGPKSLVWFFAYMYFISWRKLNCTPLGRKVAGIRGARTEREGEDRRFELPQNWFAFHFRCRHTIPNPHPIRGQDDAAAAAADDDDDDGNRYWQRKTTTTTAKRRFPCKWPWNGICPMSAKETYLNQKTRPTH